jgi:PAS domain-containing protein
VIGVGYSGAPTGIDVDTPPDPQAATVAAAAPARPWLVIGAGLAALPLCLLVGDEAGLWLPALGVGIALVSWTSWWVLALLAVELPLAYLLLKGGGGSPAMLDGALLAAQIGLSWWAYHTLARGSRWLEDPRSCMLFLVLVPGLIAAGFALAQALIRHALLSELPPLWTDFGTLWLSRILGVLVPLPLLLVLATPVLARHGLVRVSLPAGAPGNPSQYWSTGELIEVTGLALSGAVLALVLLGLHVQQGLPPWALWGVGLLIVVWAALRQGLRGGVVVAGAAALSALLVGGLLGLSPDTVGPLQGDLLAQCSTALLVGVSASWVQASEARFRHVVSEVPLVLYSAHLSHALSVTAAGSRRDGRAESLGPVVARAAMITLASRASHAVFGRPAEALVGPYAGWLDRVVPEDRELLIAALGQLGLQRLPVTCEYRIRVPATSPAGDPPLAGADGGFGPRWVRDTLTPHYTEDGLLDGWEGFVEDITERRRLSYNLRRSTQMLQALVANLPAGVFFVQGPLGYPLLANARARQLLGQREEASAPLAQLSRLYRLHRPDGSEYPAEELPVARALWHGMTCTANDVVVHRPDGRKIPLITWAAPVQLGEGGSPDAAVWVLEDRAGLQPADPVVAPGATAGDLAPLIRLIRDLAESAQKGLPAGHPSLQVLSRVLELSSRAVHLAAQRLPDRTAGGRQAE